MTLRIVEDYARSIDPGAWSLHGTEARRVAARRRAQTDVDDTEHYASVAARRSDKAGQWEHIARYLAFGMLKMPDHVFNHIVRAEREKYIDGGT